MTNNNINGTVSESTKSLMHLRPGSPQGNAPPPPVDSDEDPDEAVGGNMALGASSSKKSRSRMSRSGRRGSAKSRRSFGGFGGRSSRMSGAINEDEEEEEEDLEAGFNGRNAIPDDMAECVCVCPAGWKALRVVH